ncbi:Ig domain-containing protein [Stigmatella erecta]|uniref:Putative Ig domain-containing protein n=1 Tax=Stigmatella erecta TaxID=83460 RepID=A0A1I0KLK5_9BACT|nr:Ig domain-containing protein [Stigmatella erecta]SEU25847.1 Putative Ig domain-containing protein [Stigmatella erecta]
MTMRWSVLGWVVLCGLGATACLFDPNLSRFERCGPQSTCRSGHTCFTEENVCLPDCGLQGACGVEDPPPVDAPDGGTPPDGGAPTDGGQTPDGGEDAGTDAGIPTLKPLRWVTQSLSLATEATPYAQVLEVEGGVPPYTFRAVGSLPPGFRLRQSVLEAEDKHSAGIFDVALEVKDSATPPSMLRKEDFILTVRTLLRLAGPVTLVTGYSGTAYTERVYATGGIAPYVFKMESGSTLPPVLSLQDGGTLSGTPSNTTGVKSYRVRVTDSGNPPQIAIRDLSLDIAIPPIALLREIATQSLPDGRVGTPYHYVLKASDGMPTWSVSKGTLPSGLRLNSSTGLLEGTPDKAGTEIFTLSTSGLFVQNREFRITVY